MTIAETIPLTPQPWNKNPHGYVCHQSYLYELVQWLESQNISVMLPEDRKGWDYGIDLFICGIPVDLKGFGLREYDRSYTWESQFYRGRPRPVYKESLTEWFIHPTDGPPSKWIAARASDLRTSYRGHAPFYYKDCVVTVAELVQDVFTSRLERSTI